MHKNLKKRILRRLRNSQRGQSIILLALGFVALAAFVGLVTDISIMFVRYATLRRAVDAAAVAAAGQIREGSNYGTMAVAARQYVSMHGLEPRSVWVETCETDIAEWRAAGNTFPLADNPSTADINESTLNVVEAMERDTGPGGYMKQKFRLCSATNPRKLVRVVAQIESETTFLKLLDIQNFIITASAVSETAALDVALVLDTSGSMAVETTQVHYTNVGLLAPPTNTPPASAPFKVDLEGSVAFPNYAPSACASSKYLNPSGYTNYGRAYPEIGNWAWGGCCNDPGSGDIFQDTDGVWKIYTPNPAGIPDEKEPGEPLGITNNTKDGDYSDLICWPFKQVKDAARNFIQRLDFVRGDRVGLVGFDRTARIYDPVADDYPGPEPLMMTDEISAVQTLNEKVGVFTNPIGILSGCLTQEVSRDDVLARQGQDANLRDHLTVLAHRLRPFAYESITQCTGTNIGGGILAGSNVLTNAATIRRDSVWVAIILTDGAADASLDTNPEQIFDDNGDVHTVAYGNLGFCPWYTFCHLRTADDPIMGGGLDEYGTAPIPNGNAMWFDIPEPTSGATWYTDVGLQAGIIDGQELYRTWPQFLEDYPADGYDANVVGGTFWFNLPSYQECIDSIGFMTNDGSAALPGEFLYNNPFRHPPASRGGGGDLDNPRVWCNDNNPDTRHFCFNWAVVDEEGFTDAAAACKNAEEATYDADDYAYDMADFAGLSIIDDSPTVEGNFIALFAIGFSNGLVNSISGDATAGKFRTAAALLHYISDAGDNGQIDNDEQQALRGETPDGVADPCNGLDNQPTQPCGQYYYASNLVELEQVFEDIASRLFSRISR